MLIVKSSLMPSARMTTTINYKYSIYCYNLFTANTNPYLSIFKYMDNTLFNINIYILILIHTNTIILL